MKRILLIWPSLLLAAGLTFAVPAAALEADTLVPVGDTVGIELGCGGVMVAKAGSVDTADGSVSPASNAGISAGDIILRVNGRSTATAAEFLSAAAKLDGSPVEMLVRRGDREINFSVTPAMSADGTYRLGLWLRDGVSGIGTVTFYEPKSGVYGALGHGINELQSGALLPLGQGSILEAQVVDVLPGAEGKPGELRGSFDSGAVVGSIDSNSICGIFGHAQSGAFSGRALPVASSTEVTLGPATILSEVGENGIQEYAIEICRINRGEGELRSMMIKVTDPELLARTGGIVQGMSGSPIIQNDKLIGAVTHVLVNDPTRGYGIFIENMLDSAA